MYADRIACCPLVSHSEYATGQTSDFYITLSAMDVASVVSVLSTSY